MKFSESMFEKPFMVKEFGDDKHTIYKFEKINNHINMFMLLPDFKGKKIWKNRTMIIRTLNEEIHYYLKILNNGKFILTNNMVETMFA